MIGPSPFASIQHARKARLQRFAEAAARHASKSAVTTDTKQAVILEGYLAQPRRREYETANRPSPSMPIAMRILRAVAREFGLTTDEVLAKRQTPKYTIPRFVAIGLMIELTPMSIPAIGRRLGGRDHTTIISGRRRIEALLKSEAFRNRFDQIKAGIAG